MKQFFVIALMAMTLVACNQQQASNKSQARSLSTDSDANESMKLLDGAKPAKTDEKDKKSIVLGY